MGKIREYFSQASIDPSPLARAGSTAATLGYESGQQIRQGVNALAQGVQDVEEHVAQNETSKLAADFATAKAQLDVKWNDTIQKADPNDHEVANRFMDEEVKPVLDQIGDGLTTSQAKNLYQRMRAGVGADLFTKSAADQSALAGVAAITNLDTMKKQLSSSVYSDPSSFKGTLSLADVAIDGMVNAYHLPREKALELQQEIHTEIAKSAFLGAAEKNPQAALDALARGDFGDYITGTEEKSLYDYAHSQSRADEEEQRQQQAEQRRQDKQAFDSAQSRLSASLVDQDTGDLHVPADFFKNIAKLSLMPGADAGAIRALESAGKAILHDEEKGKPAVTDPATYADFRDRMFLGTTDPKQLSKKEVYMARAGGKLSDKDFSFFMRAVGDATKNPAQTAEGKDFGNFLKSMKGYITKSSYLKTDALGDQRYYEFQRDAQTLHDQMAGQGKSRDEIQAAIRNMIPKYQINKGQNLQAIQQRAAGGLTVLPPPNVQPRKPGESIADYNKRTGQ